METLEKALPILAKLWEAILPAVGIVAAILLQKMSRSQKSVELATVARDLLTWYLNQVPKDPKRAIELTASELQVRNRGMSRNRALRVALGGALENGLTPRGIEL